MTGKLCNTEKVRSLFTKRMVRVKYSVKIIYNVQSMINNGK